MEETLLEFRRKTEAYRTMNAELEILGVKLKHYRVDAAMEIAEEYLSNDKLNTIGIVTMQMLMQASKEPTESSVWEFFHPESRRRRDA